MSKTTHKVDLLTSIHTPYDMRIDLKECSPLVSYNYVVSLIIANGKGDEKKDNVVICDVDASIGRLDHIRTALARVFKKDMFDAYADVPKQFLAKFYLNKHTRWVFSNVFAIYERWSCRALNAVTLATTYIRNTFNSMAVHSIVINNYRVLVELSSDELKYSQKQVKV